MRRLTVPNLAILEEVRLSSQHDIQCFIVSEFMEWAVNTDGETDIRVKSKVTQS